MSPKLSDSEKVVIHEIFKNPKISLVEIAQVLDETENRRKSGKTVDVRTVSKFKSIGLKKIRKGLEELSDALRLDRTIQGETKEELDQEREKSNLLFRNGILIGYDFRIDREVNLFYLTKDHTILPWQDHLCNRNCETECKSILESVRKDHGLDIPDDVADIRNLFKITIDEIIKRSKEEKNNE
ncbi:MAG: hypothetical protein ACW964_04090 [Candidatus Hodarchaeales archaeon]